MSGREALPTFHEFTPRMYLSPFQTHEHSRETFRKEYEVRMVAPYTNPMEVTASLFARSSETKQQTTPPQSIPIPFLLPTIAGLSHEDVDLGKIYEIENKTKLKTAIKTTTIALPAISSALSSSTNMEPQRPVPLGHPMSDASTLLYRSIIPSRGNNAIENSVHQGGPKYAIPWEAASSRPFSGKRASGPKLCKELNCPRQAQGGGLCKKHGGGIRCDIAGCKKSSQSKGLCRKHGGGKSCSLEGCTRGPQRKGLCHMHGGKRLCSISGCTKLVKRKGFCIRHQGGRKECFVQDCNRSARNNHDDCWSHYRMKRNSVRYEKK